MHIMFSIIIRWGRLEDLRIAIRGISNHEEKSKKNAEKYYSSFFSGRLKVSTRIISEIPLINSKPS
jgi:hypothetical protein